MDTNSVLGGELPGQSRGTPRPSECARGEGTQRGQCCRHVVGFGRAAAYLSRAAVRWSPARRRLSMTANRNRLGIGNEITVVYRLLTFASSHLPFPSSLRSIFYTLPFPAVLQGTVIFCTLAYIHNVI